MAEAKTSPTGSPVADFIARVEPEAKRTDALLLDRLFRAATGTEGSMWGPTIIGYGEYRTVYESGRAVHNLRCGFSPRKGQALTLPARLRRCPGGDIEPLLARLGKHARGQGGCLYVNKLADIDVAVLEELVSLAWHHSFRLYPA